MITISYTRQNHGAHNGVRSIQFVLDENMGIDGMLYELTQFLRAMGYAIDSDETLAVMWEGDLEALSKGKTGMKHEIKEIMQELFKDDDNE
jgi:hypothetical protein